MKTVATILIAKISAVWHRSLASPHTAQDSSPFSQFVMIITIAENMMNLHVLMKLF